MTEVEKQHLLNEIKSHKRKVDWCENIDYKTGFLSFASFVEGLFADMQTTVNCKDCKHWGTGVVGETENVKCCEWAHFMVGANGFCVYGEKKER